MSDSSVRTAHTEDAEPEVRHRVPMWFAIALTVVVAVPFSMWLGKWDMAVWVSFIVWAQYFALGTKPKEIPTILVAYSFSVVVVGFALFVETFMHDFPHIKTPGDLAVAVVLFPAIAFLVWTLDHVDIIHRGVIALFNGTSMILAVYLTGSFPKLEGMNAHVAPLWAAVWTIVLGLFGICLALFSVWVSFPEKVQQTSQR